MTSAKPIRILALDISTNPGFAVLEVKRLKSGPRVNLVHVTSVSTTSQSPDSHRYSYIEAAATMVLHEHGPFDVVVREHYTKGRNKRSTQTVFGAWAVIDLALGKYGYKADVEITPTTVKKDVTGKGSASKDEVEAEYGGYFRFQPTLRFGQMTNRMRLRLGFRILSARRL